MFTVNVHTVKSAFRKRKYSESTYCTVVQFSPLSHTMLYIYTRNYRACGLHNQWTTFFWEHNSDSINNCKDTYCIHNREYVYMLTQPVCLSLKLPCWIELTVRKSSGGKTEVLTNSLSNPPSNKVVAFMQMWWSLLESLPFFFLLMNVLLLSTYICMYICGFCNMLTDYSGLTKRCLII